MTTKQITVPGDAVTVPQEDGSLLIVPGPSKVLPAQNFNTGPQLQDNGGGNNGGNAGKPITLPTVPPEPPVEEAPINPATGLPMRQVNYSPSVLAQLILGVYNPADRPSYSGGSAPPVQRGEVAWDAGNAVTLAVPALGHGYEVWLRNVAARSTCAIAIRIPAEVESKEGLLTLTIDGDSTPSRVLFEATTENFRGQDTTSAQLHLGYGVDVPGFDRVEGGRTVLVNVKAVSGGMLLLRLDHFRRGQVAGF